jgi:hypothetical protein
MHTTHNRLPLELSSSTKAGSICGFEVFPGLTDEPRVTVALDDEAFGLFGGPVHDPVKPGENYLSISPFMMR